MKKILSLILFLAVMTTAFAQKTISFDELHFHSNFEEVAFKNLETSSNFDLIFAVNSNITKEKTNAYKKQLANFFQVLEKKKVRKKKLKKAAKIIFETTHEYFFKKYEEYAEFHQIFKDGTFNCVTASAIYALTLEHFDIPYEIRELPTHVYIVAAPKTEHIILESTDPIDGLYTIDKTKYVKMLTKMKLISEAEIRQNSVDDLYEKYANEEEKVINFRELAGDLYYNASLQSLELEFYPKTLDLINKSLYLYDVPNAKYIKIAVQLQLADEANIEDYKSLKYVFDLLEYEEYQEVTSDNIESYNYQITKQYLIDDFDESAYWERHHYILRFINSKEFPELHEQIQLLHFKQMSYSNYLRGQKEASKNYVDSSYQIAPNDLTIQNVIAEQVIKGFQYASIQEVENNLDENIKKYPFLSERVEVLNLFFMLSSDKVSRAFLNDEETVGFAALNDFEKEFEKSTQVEDKTKEMAIGNAYGAIHSYYLRKMKSETAKEWLEKGLKKAPNSTELLRKKKLFDDYQNGKW
jgi:hypothetical protein